MAQTVTGSVIVIIVCIGAALGLLFVIKRLWVPSARRIHNDAIGPNVSVLGTTYAVLIAFMLSGVGSDMQSARLNTEQEANSLVNVYRFARELPEESRKEIRRLAREYAQAMVTAEGTAIAIVESMNRNWTFAETPVTNMWWPQTAKERTAKTPSEIAIAP